MKRKPIRYIVLFFLLFFAFYVMAESQWDLSAWYRFDIRNPLQGHLSVIKDQLLDQPAGVHGFNSIKDGHFHFQDGKRVRFWGVNLNFGACFPDHEQARYVATMLSSLGVNIVRLHSMDRWLEPDGIFDRYGILSAVQMDKLDFFIYQLRKEGIYIDMNLLVTRDFSMTNGVDEANELPLGGKPAVFFNQDLIELQKKYAKQIFTHRNPYTGLTYANDPAIAMVEIVNECSIFHYWFMGILNENILSRHTPIHWKYRCELDKKWNVWLKNKYGSAKAVTAAWRRVKSDVFIRKLDQVWFFKTSGNAVAEYKQDCKLHTVSIEVKPSQLWQVRLINKKISLKSGNYILRFTADAVAEAIIALLLKCEKEPPKQLFYQKIQLEAGEKEYEIVISVTESAEDLSLVFCLGTKNDWSVTFSEASLSNGWGEKMSEKEGQSGFNFSRPSYNLKYLYPKNQIEDLICFYLQMEESYFMDMLLFLKKDLNVCVPIACTNNFYSLASLRVQARGDYTDVHKSWDHPDWLPGEKWNRNKFLYRNNSVLKDFDNKWLTKVCSSRVNGKPQTITEWGVLNINRYAYEVPLYASVYGNYLDLDGLIALNYWNRKWPSSNGVVNFFAFAGNPQRLALMVPCAFIYGKSLIQSRPSIATLKYDDISVVEYVYKNKRKSPLNFTNSNPFMLKKILFSDLPGSEKASDTEKRRLINDELTWDKKNRLFIVNNQNVQAASGALSAKRVLLKYVEIDSKTDGSVIILSLDGKVIPESNLLFVTVVGELKNSGCSWKVGDFRWGNGPALLKAMDTRVRLVGNWSVAKVHALNASGEIRQSFTLETSFSYDSRLEIDTSMMKTPWFIIERI